jgi:hypothetical protein
MSPTIKSAALFGTAFMSACISMTSTIEVSSITRRCFRLAFLSIGVQILDADPPAQGVNIGV